jgi:hypothetical protein
MNALTVRPDMELDGSSVGRDDPSLSAIGHLIRRHYGAFCPPSAPFNQFQKKRHRIESSTGELSRSTA